MAKTISELLATLPQKGQIGWIGVRPARRESMQEVDIVQARMDVGLVGDRYAGGSGKRQITLIQQEHLHVIAFLLGRESVSASVLRRNLVVSGLNLLALKDRQFHVGGAVLEYTGACHPCSYMEEVLGDGGYNAVRGHGGITARVVFPGIIRLGDVVRLKAQVEPVTD